MERGIAGLTHQSACTRDAYSPRDISPRPSQEVDKRMQGKDLGAIVEAVHERDRHRCMNCHRTGDELTLDVHHIVPRGQGGSNQFTNLILLCRQCHDAAHGETMAPRVTWYTNGEMDSDEFELYREFFNSLDLARFDDSERCWYVPLADMDELIEMLGAEGPQDEIDETPNPAEFM